MKKTAIKDLTPVNMKEGTKYVSIDELHNSGQTVGFKYTVGDVIVIPDLNDIQVAPATFKNKKGDDVTYFRIKVGLNDVCKLFSVAAFRMNRDGVTEYDTDYCSKCEIARTLRSAGDDFERVTLLAGKTLKVKELFPGRSKKFGIAYDPNDRTTFTVQDWPIFEVIAE